MLQHQSQRIVPEPDILTFPPQSLDPIPYEVSCIAPLGRNLSFKQLYEADAHKRAAFHELAGRMFASMNLRKVYAPKPSFNAVVGAPEEFTEIIELPYDITIFRPTLAIEGTEIKRGEAVAITAGGCPFVALTFKDQKGVWRVLVMHAGTGSLIDLEHVLQGKEPREHYSAVDALIDYALAEGADPAEMILRCFFSIPVEAYQYSSRDPVHKDDNRVLLDHLSERFGNVGIIVPIDGHEHLSLETLIIVLARRRGIVNVSAHRTLPETGLFPHTRHKIPELRGTARSMEVLVIN